MKPSVLIIMGSESDRPLMAKAEEVLKSRSVDFETHVSSAHRDPDATRELVVGARERGIKVVIAGAGMSAALPGFCASYTELPVIGVPIASGALAGIDALLSITQMPSGVPVAAVGIDGAVNAAHLAVRIIRTCSD
ncbi:MAG: 5-(carboxyamino)imidazole ribonucleotide mutase [Candidatus Glassbacteria bacterium]|nr:5-(carboxyamino)imidazole ribonucleotide mutase [Candidatus Glassbacteria bacterium]